VLFRSPVAPKPRAARREPRRETSPPRAASRIDSERRDAARAQSAAARRAAFASYAGRVSAELRRHRHYPAAARAEGITGTVVVRFIIGAAGRVTTHAIVASSGHPILDRAVHRMMTAVSLPPPPGGVFRSTVPIRFDLTR
jgi:protein TonB